MLISYAAIPWVNRVAYDEFKFERNVCLNEILNTPDNSDIGYFLEVGLGYPYSIGQKTKYCPFCAEKKHKSKDDFNEYIRKIKPKNYKSHNKMICDWTDKKKYFRFSSGVKSSLLIAAKSA